MKYLEIDPNNYYFFYKKHKYIEKYKTKKDLFENGKKFLIEVQKFYNNQDFEFIITFIKKVLDNIYVVEEFEKDKEYNKFINYLYHIIENYDIKKICIIVSILMLLNKIKLHIILDMFNSHVETYEYDKYTILKYYDYIKFLKKNNIKHSDIKTLFECFKFIKQRKKMEILNINSEYLKDIVFQMNRNINLININRFDDYHFKILNNIFYDFINSNNLYNIFIDYEK